MKTTRPTESHERVFLVGVGLKRSSHVPGVDAGDAERASLEELAELARSAGAQVAGSVFQMRDKIDPATVIGRGKIEEVKIEARLHKAPLIIFDRNLTPTQLRNLERGTDCRVIDRTQLILDIFARHARSREGQLQVELAHPRSHPKNQRRDRSDPEAALAAAGDAPSRAARHCGAGWLYECGEIDALQRAESRRGACFLEDVRDARPNCARRAFAVESPRASL